MIANQVACLQLFMTDRFCYWDAKSRVDTIIIVINQTIVMTFLVIAVLRLIMLWRLPSALMIDVRKIAIIHGLVVFWGTAQLVINYYSIAVFLTLPEEMDNASMHSHSHFYAIASAFPGYTVQTLFITICYTFCNNLVKQTDIRRFPNYSIKFVYVLRIYFWFRLVVWAAAIIPIIAVPHDYVSNASFAEFVSLIVDSFIVNTFLMLALRIFISRLRNSSFMPLRREYKMMFFFSLCRIVIDCLYLGLSETDPEYCVSQIHYNAVYTILYNAIGNYILHFAPIGVVLWIYRFDYRQAQEGNQLPRSSHNLNQTLNIQ